MPKLNIISKKEKCGLKRSECKGNGIHVGGELSEKCKKCPVYNQKKH